jgi:anthranilate synthase/aminodeoxychorismate synthase-like glutamine amidotransferase
LTSERNEVQQEDSEDGLNKNQGRAGSSESLEPAPESWELAPKVLIIDNYDSFTYNLVQYLGELGANLTVRRNDEITLEEIPDLQSDRIVISPGPGVPENAGISIRVIQEFAGSTPILGVCLGHQAISVAFGGRIRLAQELKHGKTSWIFHEQDTILTGLETPFEATRYHSLIVSQNDLPECLLINAWTEDGQIMGIRHRELEVFGVQFHPESILTSEGKNLLRNFLCCKSLNSS